MKNEEVRDDRQMRALTGLSISQFDQLVIEFGIDYKRHYHDLDCEEKK